MSFRRIFVWYCDPCAKEQQREAYGLPDGWTWGGNPVAHFCNECRDPYEVLEGQQRGKLKPVEHPTP